jgi:hypothetical protein
MTRRDRAQPKELSPVVESKELPMALHMLESQREVQHGLHAVPDFSTFNERQKTFLMESKLTDLSILALEPLDPLVPQWPSLCCACQ